MPVSNPEIQSIIDRVVSRQLYDKVRPQERTELVNEAWMAVLEAQAAQGELQPYQIFGVVNHHLIAWKTQMRSALNIPINSWYATKVMGRNKRPAYRTYIGCELKDWFVDPSWKVKERNAEFHMMADRVRAKLASDDKIVLDVLLSGGSLSEGWKELARLKLPDAKRRAFSSRERIRKVWEEVVLGKQE